MLIASVISVPAHPIAAAAVTEEQVSRGGSLAEVDHRRVAPGLELSTFSRLESRGWNEGTVLTADMDDPTLSVDVVDGGTVTGTAPVSELMTSGPRGEQAVAAINGTFFDINNSGAPTRTSVGQDGIRGGESHSRPAITVADGKAAIQQLAATGSVTIAGASHDIDVVNFPTLPVNGIGLYNQIWGDFTLDRPLGAPGELPEDTARATVVDGVVTEASGIVDSAGDPDLPEGGQVLLGRDAGAHVIAGLEVGDEVQIEVGPSPDVDAGIAGTDQILTDGQVPAGLDTAVHPRTAVGVSADGSEVFLVVVDGRTGNSRGMTLPELGQLMNDIGAHNAVNLDGGGSSTMVARTAGTDAPAIQNFPSDGGERNVPHALVFYSEASAEELADLRTGAALAGEDSMFPGMQRTINGRGVAANGEALLADGTFTAEGPIALEQLSASKAVVTGNEAGLATVTYQVGSHQDQAQLRVLGELAGMIPSARSLNLADAEDKQSVTLSGFDRDGRTARIETSDVDIEVKGDFAVDDNGLGTWTISAGESADAGSVIFRHGDISAQVNLAVGTEEIQVSDFSNPGAFHGSTARATGDFRPAAGPVDEDGQPLPAIEMNYDFTTSTGTRGYYLNFAEPAQIDGQVLAFEAEIRGDGSGVWPRLQVTDAEGATTNLDGANVTHEGWQTVRFTVPEGLPQPLTIEALRMMETDPAASYHGSTAVANMRAIVTPAIDLGETAVVHDRAILTDGTVDDRAQRIAVMSDAQFVAANPESEAVDGARRTLREIRAAQPDLLIINGDFVDEASEADFELAQRILDEEWTDDIPYIYVPGNHEIMGGPIENFKNAFGETTTEQALGRTQIITLDSSAGSLRVSDYDQIAELERQLDAVAENDERTGVVVFFHHPPRDPLPTAASALTDQREARAIEDLLAEFRDTTGKSAAVVNAGVGVFHGSAVEGVTYLINGNSGKNPSGTPETGGFTGWTMLGINPGAGLVGLAPDVEERVEWLAAETKPWVDAIALSAPAAVPEDESSDISATIVQDGQTIPVRWPMSAQWGGDGVAVDDGTGDDETDVMGYADNPVVRVNPATGTLTGLRPGTATVTVTVNGATAAAEITVPGEPAEQPEPSEPDEKPEPSEPAEQPEPSEPVEQPEPGEAAGSSGDSALSSGSSLGTSGSSTNGVVGILATVGGLAAVVIALMNWIAR